jgi:hypothetical protein
LNSSKLFTLEQKYQEDVGTYVLLKAQKKLDIDTYLIHQSYHPKPQPRGLLQKTNFLCAGKYIEHINPTIMHYNIVYRDEGFSTQKLRTIPNKHYSSESKFSQ